ncbi:MAG: MFS transporter, partial [Planctomycetaceae bacterium]
MMFLQFFIWGVWYVPMFPYLTGLGVEPGKIGFAYSMTGIAAMISPFFVGLIADRFFPSQVVLGVLHLIGGVLLYLCATADNWNTFWPFLLLHLICYMPTLAMVNSVSFQNMEDPQKQFPPVRTLGTIGWIVSGILLGSSFFDADGYRFSWPKFLLGPDADPSWIPLGATKWPYYIGAGASVLLGMYSFILPHTPPKMKGQQISIGDVLGLKALRLMKDRSFATFIICSFLICIPLSFYYQNANGFLQAMDVPNSEGVMTLGQFS